MNKVSIFDANISHFRKGFSNAAKKDIWVAEKMVFEHGLRGDVDNKFVRKILPDHFDKQGNLTGKGKENIRAALSVNINRAACSVKEFFKNYYFVAMKFANKQK